MCGVASLGVISIEHSPCPRTGSPAQTCAARCRSRPRVLPRPPSDALKRWRSGSTCHSVTVSSRTRPLRPWKRNRGKRRGRDDLRGNLDLPVAKSKNSGSLQLLNHDTVIASRIGVGAVLHQVGAHPRRIGRNTHPGVAAVITDCSDPDAGRIRERRDGQLSDLRETARVLRWRKGDAACRSSWLNRRAAGLSRRDSPLFRRSATLPISASPGRVEAMNVLRGREYRRSLIARGLRSP